MFCNFSFFAKPSMDFIHDDKPSLNILWSTVPIPVHDLKIKLTDFEFFLFVKSLRCQLLQSLWLISIVFGINGCKILKCFRKEQHISGELPCPATGLIVLQFFTISFFSQSLQWILFIYGMTTEPCLIFHIGPDGGPKVQKDSRLGEGHSTLLWKVS